MEELECLVCMALNYRIYVLVPRLFNNSMPSFCSIKLIGKLYLRTKSIIFFLLFASISRNYRHYRKKIILPFRNLSRRDAFACLPKFSEVFRFEYIFLMATLQHLILPQNCKTWKRILFNRETSLNSHNKIQTLVLNNNLAEKKSRYQEIKKW